jgi:hypothetical protein
MAGTMSKFRVKVELQGLKFEIEGDREIGSTIAQNVANQIANVMQPAALLEAPKNGQNGHGHVVVDAAPGIPVRKRRKSPAKSGGSADGDGAPVVNWNHDPTKWGAPLQTWKQPQKINWLLHVVEQETGKKDLAPAEMVDIFRLKFRDAGLLHRGNIPKNLGNNPEFFGSVDGRWFLKQGGKDAAANLIAEAKGEKITA